MNKTCPLMGLWSCEEDRCAFWDANRLECAVLSIEKELSDLGAELRQKRLAEMLKEGN